MWNKRSGSNQKGLTKKSFREWKDKEKNFSHATSARNQGTLSQNVKTLTNQLQEKVLQAKIKEIIDENMGRHGRLIVRRRNIRRKSQPLPYGRHNIKRFKNLFTCLYKIRAINRLQKHGTNLRVNKKINDASCYAGLSLPKTKIINGTRGQHVMRSIHTCLGELKCHILTCPYFNPINLYDLSHVN